MFICFRRRPGIFKMTDYMMKHLGRKYRFCQKRIHQPLIMGFPFFAMRQWTAGSLAYSQKRHGLGCFHPNFMMCHFVNQCDQEIKLVKVTVYRYLSRVMFYSGPVISEFGGSGFGYPQMNRVG